MATIPVYLTDDDGNLIEQTSGSGDYIIVGYVNQSLFANTSGELYTTFFDVVQAATPEQKAEVLRGLRLAKGIRGDLRRFELSGTSDNAYVKYNHSIFGGRFRSQYTALGSIAGTYLRRGGSSFTKELVEAALVTGPTANFSLDPLTRERSLNLSGTASAFSGTPSFSWEVTSSNTQSAYIVGSAEFIPDGDTKLNPIPDSSVTFDNYLNQNFGDNDPNNVHVIEDFEFNDSTAAGDTWLIRVNYGTSTFNGQDVIETPLDNGDLLFVIVVDGVAYELGSSYNWRNLNGDSFGVLESQTPFDPAVDNTVTRLFDNASFTHNEISALVAGASSVAIELREPYTYAPITGSNSSITLDLVPADWNVKLTVTDGTDTVEVSKSVTVADFEAAGLSVSESAPSLGQLVTISLDSPIHSSLIDTTEWSFGSAPTTEYYDLSQANVLETRSRIEVPIVEGVDYEIASSSDTEIRVRFLTGGQYHVNAIVKYDDGSVAGAFRGVDIDPSDNIGFLPNNHSLSLETANALYSGDAHVIILGDSLMNIFAGDRLARGLREEWRPARWAGLQHVRDDVSTNVAGLAHEGGAGLTQASSDNINRDGTNSDGDPIASPEFAAARYTPAQAHNGEFTITASSVSASSSPLYLTTRNSSLNYVAGRLQGKDDTFDRTAGLRTDMLFVGVDTGVTLDIDTPNGTATSPSSITLTSGEIARASTTWNPSPSFLNEAGLRLSWDSQTIGEKFGVIDGYTYNPNVSGLSVSYMGDGGWDIGNHAGPYALDSDGNPGTSTHANSNEWYDDTSIEEHLKMVAYKDYAQTTLRDKIVVLFENQNATSMGYQNAVRSSLLAVRSRWENAANAVDPSGQLFSRIQFVWMTLPEIRWAESHAAFAAQAREFMGQGGYSWLEIVDLNQQLREYAPGDGLDYSIPQTYTDVYFPSNQGGGLIREADLPDGSEWYAGGDMVHPDLPGSLIMMSEFWKIVEAAASPAIPISGGTISASATDVLTTDSVTFSLTGLVAEADRAVAWCNQDGTEIGRGEVLTTTLSAITTRVDAKVSTASGSEATITGPAMTVSTPNQGPIVFQALAVQGSNPVEGQSFNLTISAVDPDGDDLTYTLSSTAADIGSITRPNLVEAVIPVTAGTAGVTVTYTVTVTDPDGASAVSTLDVTPDAANTAPAISSGLAVEGSNPAEGDSFDLIVTATDADGDTLTYTLSSTAGDSDSVGPVAADTEARFSLTAGTAGVAVTYTVSIDDGTAAPVTSQLTVTPSAALPPLAWFNNAGTAGPSIAPPAPAVVGDTIEFGLLTTASVGALGDNYQVDIYESVDGGPSTLVQSDTITQSGTFVSNVVATINSGIYTTTNPGSILFSVRVTHLPSGQKTAITPVTDGPIDIFDPANILEVRLSNSESDKQVWVDAGLLPSNFVTNNNVFVIGTVENGSVVRETELLSDFIRESVTLSAVPAAADDIFHQQFLWFGSGTGNYLQANIGGMTSADRSAIATALNDGTLELSAIGFNGVEYLFNGGSWLDRSAYVDYDGASDSAAGSVYTRADNGVQSTTRPSTFATPAVHTLRIKKLS